MREVVSFLHSYYTIQVFANCLHVAGQCVPISSRQRRKFIRLFRWKHFVQLKVVLETRVRCVRKRKAHLVHFYYPDIPSWESWSETAMAQIFCCEPNVSPSVSLHFFLFELRIKAISWLSLSETCASPVCESEAVCGSAYVCVPVIVLPCAESLHEAEWSRMWRNLSDLGYRRKHSFCYYLLLFLFLLIEDWTGKLCYACCQELCLYNVYAYNTFACCTWLES